MVFYFEGFQKGSASEKLLDGITKLRWGVVPWGFQREVPWEESNGIHPSGGVLTQGANTASAVSRPRERTARRSREVVPRGPRCLKGEIFDSSVVS